MSARRRIVQVLAGLALAAGADAHSVSDAYLVLQAAPPAAGARIEAQWDIALRDLDFVVGLDRDGDGNITWAEVRAQRSAIERYAYARLQASADGRPCAVAPGALRIAQHPDGAYAALHFALDCGARPARLTLDYSLLFAVDPSHRGLFQLRSAAGIATAVLAPDRARIEVKL